MAKGLAEPRAKSRALLSVAAAAPSVGVAVAREGLAAAATAGVPQMLRVLRHTAPEHFEDDTPDKRTRKLFEIIDWWRESASRGGSG